MGWTPSTGDPNSGTGPTGSCCTEMDIVSKLRYSSRCATSETHSERMASVILSETLRLIYLTFSGRPTRSPTP